MTFNTKATAPLDVRFEVDSFEGETSDGLKIQVQAGVPVAQRYVNDINGFVIMRVYTRDMLIIKRVPPPELRDGFINPHHYKIITRRKRAGKPDQWREIGHTLSDGSPRYTFQDRPVQDYRPREA